MADGGFCRLDGVCTLQYVIGIVLCVESVSICLLCKMEVTSIQRRSLKTCVGWVVNLFPISIMYELSFVATTQGIFNLPLILGHKGRTFPK